jgi:hypothetical protein
MAKLQAISHLHERQVNTQDLDMYVLPVLEQVYREDSGYGDREAAIEQFAFAVSKLQAANDTTQAFMSDEAKKALGDIILNEQYKPVRVMSQSETCLFQWVSGSGAGNTQQFVHSKLNV